MKKIVASIVLLWLSVVPASSDAPANDANGLPGDLPEFTITQNGETAPGVLMGSVSSTVEGVGSYFLILDNTGYPLFYSRTQSLGRLECNGLFSSRREIEGLKKKYTWYLQDEEFNEVDTLQMGNGYLADNHAFQLLPNGHVLMLSYDQRTIDMSEIAEGGHPAAMVTGAVIQELDADRQVIFQWRTWDHIPIVDSYRDITQKNSGYIHVNGVALDPVDGHIIVTCRETSEVVKVNRVTGEVLWRFGGRDNDFTFTGEHEENAPYYFVGQHAVWRFRNGNILFFDNGNISGGGLTESDRDYSRAVEYHLDEVNMTATLVWEYRHDPDIMSPSGGRVQPLANGNVLIDWGRAIPLGTPEVPLVTEVSPAGDLVYELHYATATKGARLQKYVWNSPDLVQSQTHFGIAPGNTYDSNETGVTVTVNSLDGPAYNGLVVKRHAEATRFPRFAGKAP